VWKEDLDPAQTSHFKRAITHQNTIRWDNYLWEYISWHWQNIHQQNKGQSKKLHWNDQLAETTITLHITMWWIHNEMVHVTTILEQRQKAREAIIHRVCTAYRENPKLTSHYAAIYEVPLECSLKKRTDALVTWLDRIEHQKQVTKY
jgi:hypothetical protein